VKKINFKKDTNKSVKKTRTSNNSFEKYKMRRKKTSDRNNKPLTRKYNKLNNWSNLHSRKEKKKMKTHKK
jgi:hypothetical protein